MKGTKTRAYYPEKGGSGRKKGKLLLPSFLPLYFSVHAFSTLQTQLSQSLEQDSTKSFLESAVSEEGAGMVEWEGAS